MKRFFFGYGSLVHKGTHEHDNCFSARLNGWTRAWVATPARALPYLSAIPNEGAFIDGLIAQVEDEDWSALDEREAAYERVVATQDIDHTLKGDAEIVVYSVAFDAQLPVSSQNPILLSYLDVVVQGYFDLAGTDGVEHFFDTTGGWTGAYLDDRISPIYPRAQFCDPILQEEINERLKRLGQVRVRSADFPLW